MVAHGDFIQFISIYLYQALIYAPSVSECM